MKTVFKEYGTTATITDHRDGTATLKTRTSLARWFIIRFTRTTRPLLLPGKDIALDEVVKNKPKQGCCPVCKD